ncbi:MAG: c-type cytochrome [Pseudomonadota bacterium]
MARQIPILMLMSGAMALAACGGETMSESDSHAVGYVAGPDIVRHSANAENGRDLFVSKGCVICHSVNGVGGKAAPVLDATVGSPAIDPLEFAARMWRGAPAMIELQSIELGYTIYLTADEIGDLAAFHASRDAQAKLSVDDLPENIKNGLLDERFWEMEDWDDFLRSGQEGDFTVEDTPMEDDPQQ